MAFCCHFFAGLFPCLSIAVAFSVPSGKGNFFHAHFRRLNFSALSCGGFLGAVSGRGFLNALVSSGLVHVVFRIAFSVRSIGAAFYLSRSRFVWAFFALFQKYFFPAFFRETPLPRTFFQERLPLALSWGIFCAIVRMDSFHGLISGLFFHAFFRSVNIHGLIPLSLFRALICSYFLRAIIRRTSFPRPPLFAGLLLHYLSQGFYRGLFHGGTFRALFCRGFFGALSHGRLFGAFSPAFSPCILS